MSLWLVLALLAGCNGGGEAVSALASLKPACDAQRDALTRSVEGVRAQLASTDEELGGHESYKAWQQVSGNFESIEGHYTMTAAQLCESLGSGEVEPAVYEAQRACLDRVTVAMDEIKVALSDPSVRAVPERAAWALEAKFSHLTQLMSCEVAEDATRGRLQVKGTLALVAGAAGAVKQGRINLKARMLCQRKLPSGAYEDVPDCDQARLVEDDRFKLSFKVDRDAHVYIVIFNNSGQFQMLFPQANIPNRAIGGASYFMPPKEEDWFELDDVGGVIEHIQIIAATDLVEDLERFRENDIEADSGGSNQQMAKLAMNFRGKIEPLVYRGVKKDKLKPEELEINGETVKTVAVEVGGEDVVVYEFELTHGFRSEAAP